MNWPWDSEFCSFWYSISLVYPFLVLQLSELVYVGEWFGGWGPEASVTSWPHIVRLCCSVNKSRLTLCDPMNCSTPGFPVFTITQNLLKLIPIDLVMPFNHLILCAPFSSCSHSFQPSGSFSMSWLFASGGQSIGGSGSASVLPMNIQD